MIKKTLRYFYGKSIYRVLFQYEKKKEKKLGNVIKNSTNLIDRIFLKYFMWSIRINKIKKKNIPLWYYGMKQIV